MPITADRQTILQLDIGEVTVQQPEWHYQRRAREIAPGASLPAGVAPGRDTFLAARDAWILTPRGASDPMEFVRFPAPPPPAGVLDYPDFNAAPSVQSEPTFKPATDITGMQADPTLFPSGAPAFQRGIPAGADASTLGLPADQAAQPSPTPPYGTAYPMDRTLSGRRTHQDNAPFYFSVSLPEELVGQGVFASFHFGGSTDVTPTGHSGGQYCLMLSGTGKAFLFEWDKFLTSIDKWVLRKELHLPVLSRPSVGTMYAIRVIPYGRNRIDFRELAIDTTAINLEPLSRLPIPVSGTAHPERSEEFWLDLPAYTGHSHWHSSTGPGPVRVDMRRDYTGLVMIAAMAYPLFGTLVDSPFFIPYALPAGTDITLKLNGWTPAGTSIAAFLYSAADGTAVPFNAGSHTFKSIGGQSAYYVGFTFTTNDGLQTPVLFGYTVSVPATLTTHPKVPTISTWLHSVHVTGPDLTPDQEQAFIHLNDPDNVLPVVRIRDRVRCLLSVVSPSLNRVVAHLGEFETKSPPAKYRGKPSYQWPVPGWRDYPNMMLQGLWARIVGQYALHPVDFGTDTNAPFDPQFGNQPPWKITDIIRFCFQQAAPNDEIDIPDIPLRLWAGDKDLFGGNGFMLQRNADYGRIIQTLALDYFNAPIIRDANAGSRGMWRMGFAPAAGSTNYLASFLIDDPAIPGPVEVMGVNSYSSTANVVPFQEGTFNTLPVAPEFTLVIVTGQTPGAGDGDGLIQTSLGNPDALNNGASADYLGFFLPFIRKADPSLQTQEACNWIAHRIYDLAGHRQLWWEGRAPLLLIRDTLDPLQNSLLFRPLRINDLVLVGGARALVRSCNPRWNDSDQIQMADYEGVFL